MVGFGSTKRLAGPPKWSSYTKNAGPVPGTINHLNKKRQEKVSKKLVLSKTMKIYRTEPNIGHAPNFGQPWVSLTNNRRQAI